MYESLRIDQKQRWQSGERILVETYLQRFPGLADDTESLVDLVYGEFLLRESRGESPRLQEYLERFPQCSRQLEEQFKLHNAGAFGSTPPGLVPASSDPLATSAAGGYDTILDNSKVAASSRKVRCFAEPTTSDPAAANAAAGYETITTELPAGVAIGSTPPSPVPNPPDPLATSAAARYETITTELPSAAAIESAPSGSAPKAPDPLATNLAAGCETILNESSGELADSLHNLHGHKPVIPGFEILGELGRGGMGIVYRARQLSADRLVALKVVRNDVLDTLPLASRTSTLERFRYEAQAAAKLEHDNLVTVYEVGEANGLRYYAMRYVSGRSLYEMLQDGPFENRRAAKYLEPVARALHAAHQSGVLHRDLKPHNIMVDTATDRPLVTDFGLAKFLEKRDELTHSGDLMGTPSYMSPEQARDPAHVTALADVYSLGATLYHLITARPPFQAANVAETIRQIIYQEPVSPRQLNPAIDRDLETICLKCLQKEPARRYVSCEALAEDLQCYLTGRPILARPVTRIERTIRWCRRNPVLASFIGLAASFAIATVVVFVIGYRNTTAALATSEFRLQKALQVVDELFTRLSEDELLNEPGMQPLRKDLLERALKHYQFFLAESGGNPAIQDEIAAARFRVGMINQLMKSLDIATNELTAARDLQRKLLDKTPDDPKRIRALGDTLNQLGNVHKENHMLVESKSAYTDAEEIRARLVKQQPGDRELQRLLANAHMNLGMVEMDRENVDEARTHMERAQASRQRILVANPEWTKLRRDLAMGHYNLATLALSSKKNVVAAQHLSDAIKEFEWLRTHEERVLANRYYLGVCYRLLGGLRADDGDITGALEMYSAATSRINTLAVGNPDVPDYQSELAILAMNQGALYDEKGDLASAEIAWSQALGKLRGLLQTDARNPDYRCDLATTLGALGSVQIRNGNFPAAAKSLNEARSCLQELIAEFPRDENLGKQLEETLADLANLADQTREKK